MKRRRCLDENSNIFDQLFQIISIILFEISKLEAAMVLGEITRRASPKNDEIRRRKQCVFENTAAEMQVIWHEVNSRVNDEVRFRASN